jgi:hypothetical protein
MCCGRPRLNEKEQKVKNYRDRKANKLKRIILADKRRKKLIDFLSKNGLKPNQISEFLKKNWDELGNRKPNDMLYKKKDFARLLDFTEQYVEALKS